MKIGVIGGMARTEPFFRKMAKEKGHEFEFHSGELSRRSIEGMRSLVERSDVVIILTGINSHQAVWLAKQTAREFMRPSILMYKCGPDSFRELLDLLGGPGQWAGMVPDGAGRGNMRRIRSRFPSFNDPASGHTGVIGTTSVRRTSVR